jgi:hypothetical protein
MTVYYDSDVERLSPNSGETTVSWLKGSGLMSIEQLTSSLNDVIACTYGNLSTSGQFSPYSPVSQVVGTARHVPVKSQPSPEEAAFESRRAKLIAAVTSMRESAPDWYAGGAKVSEESASTAEKFLRCLPARSILPKVAADGEGDVMFVWEDGGVSCIVTVEPKILHLVSNPGGRGQQIDEQRFLGVEIPPTILRHIPRSK